MAGTSVGSSETGCRLPRPADANAASRMSSLPVTTSATRQVRSSLSKSISRHKAVDGHIDDCGFVGRIVYTVRVSAFGTASRARGMCQRSSAGVLEPGELFRPGGAVLKVSGGARRRCGAIWVSSSAWGLERGEAAAQSAGASSSRVLDLYPGNARGCRTRKPIPSESSDLRRHQCHPCCRRPCRAPAQATSPNLAACRCAIAC